MISKYSHRMTRNVGNFISNLGCIFNGLYNLNYFIVFVLFWEVFFFFNWLFYSMLGKHTYEIHLHWFHMQ